MELKQEALELRLIVFIKKIVESSHKSCMYAVDLCMCMFASMSMYRNEISMHKNEGMNDWGSLEVHVKYPQKNCINTTMHSQAHILMRPNHNFVLLYSPV